MVNPTSSHYMKKIFFISLTLYLYEIIDMHLTYCDNHFMTLGCQAIHVKQCFMSVIFQ